MSHITKIVVTDNPYHAYCNNSTKPRGLIQNSTFKGGGLFKNQENTLQKEIKKRLEVLKNELDKMAFTRHRCSHAKKYSKELLINGFFDPIWQGIGGGLIREGRLLKNSPFKGGFNRIIMVYAGFLLGIFSGGGQNLLLCKVLLLCYCFRTKIQRGAKVFRGAKKASMRLLIILLLSAVESSSLQMKHIHSSPKTQFHVCQTSSCTW